jgi:hypothetical protein
MTEADRLDPPPSAALMQALAAHPEHMADLIVALNQPVHDVRSLLVLLHRVAAVAVARLDGISAAGITAQFHEEPITVSHTDERVLILDEHQYGAGDGPCLRAMRTGHKVGVSRAVIEQRWPALGAAAAAIDVGSVLALPLHLSGSALGALNLYSRQGNVPEPDADTLTVLVEYAQRGLEAYQRCRQSDDSDDSDDAELQQAVAGWAAVERAVGMLMEQYGFSGQYARAVLGDLAEDWQRTLIDQALHIIGTGTA